jgi:hypothetical protein
MGAPLPTVETRVGDLERLGADSRGILSDVDARTLQKTIAAFDASGASLGEFIGLKPGDGHIQFAREPQTGLLLVSVTKVKPKFVWQPDAAPTAIVTTGNEQGGYHHSGAGFTATKVWVDCKTAPGVNGLTVVLQYADTDDLDTAVNWTQIVSMTLSSERSKSQVLSVAVPANRVMRMNVSTADATVRGVSVGLEGDYG